MSSYIIQNTEYKNGMTWGLAVSVLLHIWGGYYAILNYEKPAKITNLKVEDVEFLSKEEVIKRRKEKDKKILPKIEMPKPKIEEKIEPRLEDKKIELKVEPKKFETKQLDVITPIEPKGLQVKALEMEPKLVSRTRHDLSATEVKQLININEVGDRKISQKTLELAEQLQKSVRVKSIEEPKAIQLENKQKSLTNLDRKIATMDDEKRINLASKTYEMAKIESTVRMIKKISGAGFDSNPKTMMKDEPVPARQMQSLKNVKIVEAPQKVEMKEKSFENVSIEDKKINKEAKSKNISFDLKSVESSKVKEKGKNFDILGEIKDRPIIVFVSPEYPDWAKQQKIEANVRVYLEVAKDGKVIDSSLRIEITSGYLVLDKYVMDVLKFWRFAAILQDETQQGSVTFKFRLT